MSDRPEAFVTMACVCGSRISAPCPSLNDLSSVLATFAGWGWDAQGLARCPKCLGITPTKPAPDQAELF